MRPKWTILGSFLRVTLSSSVLTSCLWSVFFPEVNVIRNISWASSLAKAFKGCVFFSSYSQGLLQGDISIRGTERRWIDNQGRRYSHSHQQGKQRFPPAFQTMNWFEMWAGLDKLCFNPWNLRFSWSSIPEEESCIFPLDQGKPSISRWMNVFGNQIDSVRRGASCRFAWLCRTLLSQKG